MPGPAIAIPSGRGRRCSGARARTPSGSLLVLALVAAAAVGCNSDRQGPRLTEGTVTVDWRLTLRLPSGEMVARPVAIAGDERGGVWIADASTQTVWLARQGDSVPRTLGRRGEGPGEFRNVVALHRAGDGAIWAADPGNGRLTRFSVDGAIDTSVALALPCLRLPWPGALTQRGYVGLTAGNCDSIGTLWASASRQAWSLPAPPPMSSEVFRVSRGATELQADVPFQPARLWRATSDGHIAVLSTDAYALDWLTLWGDTVLRQRLPGKRAQLTHRDREFAQAELKWFLDAGGDVDWSKLPKLRPAAVSFSVGERGQALVQRYAGPDSLGRVFDLWVESEHTPTVLHLPLSHHLGPADPVLVKNRLIVLHQTDLGEFEIVVFRVGP